MVRGEAGVVGVVPLVILTGAWRGLLPLCAPAAVETMIMLTTKPNNTANPDAIDLSSAHEGVCRRKAFLCTNFANPHTPILPGLLREGVEETVRDYFSALLSELSFTPWL